MSNAISSLALLFIGLCMFTACPADDEPIITNDCVQYQIDSLLSIPVTNPPGTIEQWEVDGSIYYYVTAGCCDFFNLLFDDDCQYVCAPSGGITGNGDRNCPDFQGEIVKSVIWEDPRE